MIYLLDTDTLTHLWQGRRAVLEHLDRLDPSDEVGTTIVTRIEILRGRFDAVLKAATGPEIHLAQSRLIESESALAGLFTAKFDEAVADRFDRLRAVKGARKIGRADLLIASITLTWDATLATRNLRHFTPIPGLRVENRVD